MPIEIAPGQILRTLDEFIVAKKMQENGVQFQVERYDSVWVDCLIDFSNLAVAAIYRRSPHVTEWTRISPVEAIKLMAHLEKPFWCQFEWPHGHKVPNGDSLWLQATLAGVRLDRNSTGVFFATGYETEFKRCYVRLPIYPYLQQLRTNRDR